MNSTSSVPYAPKLPPVYQVKGSNYLMRADTKEIIGTVDPDLLPAIVCACNSHVASVAALKAAVQIGVIGIKYADSIEGARPKNLAFHWDGAFLTVFSLTPDLLVRGMKRFAQPLR